MDYQQKLDDLYHKLYEGLYSFLLAQIKMKKLDELQSEIPDCIQDAFILLWSKPDVIKNHSNIEGWLYSASSNMLKNRISIHHNRRKHIAFSLDQREEEDMDTYGNVMNIKHVMREQDCDSAIENVRADVGEENYKMLIDYYDKDVPMESVARKYNLSAGALKMRVNRIIKKLRE